MPLTWVYNLCFVYKQIVDVLCVVFHSSTIPRLLVNADWLLTEAMHHIVFFSKQAQDFVVQVETPLHNHYGTAGGAIQTVLWHVCRLQGGFEKCCVDMMVI